MPIPRLDRDTQRPLREARQVLNVAVKFHTQGKHIEIKCLPNHLTGRLTAGPVDAT